MSRRALTWMVVCGLTIAASPVVRGDEPESAMNRVSFQVEATREVANDRVSARVGVTEEGAQPAELADRVNQTMAWGLGVAQQAKGVTVESGPYHTSPVYEKGQIRRWRASQDLILEGPDVAQIGELIGELQSRLLLRSIQFSVSPERQRALEDELIQEALTAFRARSELIRKGLERRSYTIVHLAIGQSGRPPERPMRAAVQELSLRKVAPPALEGGSSTLKVSISATIELE
jgi:predicted secreted protein